MVFPIDLPLTKNWTLAMPLWVSLALAVRVNVEEVGLV